MPNTLPFQHLRRLGVDPQTHPRGRSYISAASGLVCENGRVYVIADDEHHLAVFDDRRSPGVLVRVFPGDLPKKAKPRKRMKPDLETLFLLPASGPTKAARLVALGSGSRPNRQLGAVIPLQPDGRPAPWRQFQRFDLAPLYRSLTALLGEINIEGAMVIGDELVLLNRGLPGRSPNATARYRLADVLALIGGDASALKPRSVQRFRLGAIDGVALGFTDAAALPDGGWVFCAVAEDRTDSVADGRCTGSVVGVVTAGGKRLPLQRLAPNVKVEGIDVRASASGMTVCLVTDADDPKQSSTLLLAQL